MTPTDIPAYMTHLGLQARAAARALARAGAAQKNAALLELARLLRAAGPELHAANARDIHAAQSRGLSAPMIERLRLTTTVGDRG